MIRSATEKDAFAIAAIHVRAWQAAYDGVLPHEFLTGLSVQKRAQFWQQELIENRSCVLVSEKESVVVGWISGGSSRDSDAKGEAEVYAVYVAPDFWRHGVGRQLMGMIEERLQALADVTLWVLAQNKRAIDFYRAIGYEFDGAEKSGLIAGVTISEVRLRKKRPNQSPEPTPLAVTPRADARVAPSSVVAHL